MEKLVGEGQPMAFLAPGWRRGGGLAVSHKIERRRAKKEKSASARVRGDDDEGGRISK